MPIRKRPATDFDNDPVHENRRKFQNDYNVKSFYESKYSAPKHVNERVCKEFGKDINSLIFDRESGFDHTRVFRTRNETIIVITSPYEGHINDLINQGKFNVSNSWTEIYPLYDLNARTFLKEFPIPKNMFKKKHLQLVREWIPKFVHKDLVDLVIKCIPNKN